MTVDQPPHESCHVPNQALGLPWRADGIERLAQRLLAAADELRSGRPLAYVHIVDNGAAVRDEVVGWWDILSALCLRQLPIRIHNFRRFAAHPERSRC
ncbi:hypothetical protein AB0B10_19500 [Micromonospora arborensis]|uniref:hypothetical protein n=1 Tax=Micromonospora arborensis TaxID=2116518 RepID=UPI003409E6C3